MTVGGQTRWVTPLFVGGRPSSAHSTFGAGPHPCLGQSLAAPPGPPRNPAAQAADPPTGRARRGVAVCRGPPRRRPAYGARAMVMNPARWPSQVVERGIFESFTDRECSSRDQKQTSSASTGIFLAVYVIIRGTSSGLKKHFFAGLSPPGVVTGVMRVGVSGCTTLPGYEFSLRCPVGAWRQRCRGGAAGLPGHESARRCACFPASVVQPQAAEVLLWGSGTAPVPRGVASRSDYGFFRCVLTDACDGDGDDGTLAYLTAGSDSDTGTGFTE